ncbi:MAG TPA: hypothetical protein VJ552_05300 [Sediminibacterium sp.]|nr:hypothetical protein [Sediminibacterium sp.]
MSTFVSTACCGYGAVSVITSGDSGSGSSVALSPPQEEWIVGAAGSPIAADVDAFTWLPTIGKNIKVLIDGVLVMDKNKNPSVTDRQWVQHNINSGEIKFKDKLFAGQRITILY